ncbi:MAG: class I SAM-dependent methyltransferase, partial [Bacteroidota bacterium]
KSSLNPIELELLGNLEGKTILHLQCHFGLDSLSLAKRGAKVIGVDLSDKAIAKAKQLNAELGLDVEFVCCNIYDLPQQLFSTFDIVFTSYGVIGWLPDLNKWASVIQQFIKPNGQFVMVEFHPVLNMLGWQWNGTLPYSYFNQGVLLEESEGSYTDRNAPIKNLAAEWDHSLAEVFNSLLNQHLQITHFQEYDYSPYNCFAEATALLDGNWQIKGIEGKVPLLFSVVAQKKKPLQD